MRRGYDERELEAIERSRDAELTLSPTTLLALFFGLVLLCGACFGLGYALGHREPAGPAVAGSQPAAGADTSGSAAGSREKPSATAQAKVAPPPAQTVVSMPPSSGSGSNAASSAASSGKAPAAAEQWTVKPALPPQAVQPSTTAAGGVAVQAATAPTQALMVQIAAVSHQEDADVLVAALRKRGYAVTVHRDLADSLMHVQIGPFTNRNDADAMRSKLLNDGYNAIVQP